MVQVVNFWLVSFLFVLANNINAQELGKINFQANGISVDEAIQNIANQTGYTYSYNPSIFESHPKVYCNVKRELPLVIFNQIINDASISIKQLDNSFVFYQKQPNQVKLSGKISNYRTGKPLPNVRLSIKQANLSTITDSLGKYQFSFGTYLDSFEVYFFHQDFNEKKIQLRTNVSEMNLSLMPIPEYYSFLPSIKFEPLYEPVASVEKNFLVKAFIADEVLEQNQISEENPSDTNKTIEPIEKSHKTPFLRPSSIWFCATFK